jgi:GxxExxY protein
VARLEHAEITDQIIGGAISVHKALGPGFIESVYEAALVHELRKRGLDVEQQVEVTVEYDGIVVGRHRLDLFVANTIVVELKATKELDNVHFAVVKSYLRAMRQKHALLLNFAKTKLQVRRVMVE